ncbi:MAG: KilA-N domain-containing protein [Mediterranea sp.]|jgi:hypothetical protein|nr:KilA-N domain-containing protein [Mediterranea sp.]
METKICVFNETPITFALGKNNGMMVNATEMAKVFNRDLYQFTKSEDTKRFIEACQKPANAGILGIANEEDLIISRQKSGTYMHRVLALKFAAWLSPDFEVWVYSTIERLLFGRHVQREQSFERTLKLQKELDELKEKEQKTGDDFERYLLVDKELRREKAIRKSLTAETVTGMRSLFDQE